MVFMIFVIGVLISLVGSYVGYKTNGFRQLPGTQRKALGASLKKNEPLFPDDLAGGQERPIYNVTNPFSPMDNYRGYASWQESQTRYREFRRYKLYRRIRAVYLATKSTEVKTKAQLVLTNQLFEADDMFQRIYDIDKTTAQNKLQEHLDLIEKNVEALERGELQAFAIEANTFKNYVETTIEGTIVPSALDLSGLDYKVLAATFRQKEIEPPKPKFSPEDEKLLKHYQAMFDNALARCRAAELRGHTATASKEKYTASQAKAEIDSIRKRAK